MAVRKKLNQAYISGSLLVSGLLGLVTESWLIFIVALGISLAMNSYNDEIRPDKRGRR